MKTMKHTTKTNHKLLILNDLGEGIGFAVTSSFTCRYRAFRRCQTRAQAEGFVRFRPPDADGMAHSQDRCLLANCCRSVDNTAV
jgi:hypothetical protein